MSIEDDIAFLERVPALAILGRDALRILAIGSESRYIHEGISLFGEGEDADSAYVVQEGSFDLVSEKNTIAASVAGPGTLIGELALLTETKRPVGAVARERCAHAGEFARGLVDARGYRVTHAPRRVRIAVEHFQE